MIEASFGYVNYELTDNEGNVLLFEGDDCGGERCYSPRTPEFTGGLGIQYGFALLGGTVTPRLDLTYQSKIYFTTNNGCLSTTSDVGCGVYGAQDALTLLNGRVTWMAPDGDWEVALYGKQPDRRGLLQRQAEPGRVLRPRAGQRCRAAANWDLRSSATSSTAATSQAALSLGPRHPVLITGGAALFMSGEEHADTSTSCQRRPVCRGDFRRACQELPTAKPESVGMSSERLKRIDSVMQRHIAAGTIANAVTLVMRDGKVVHYKAHGPFDPATGAPMRTDTLFYMVSSSKPITAVAVLMMVEEGLVRLDDPVSRFIPEFKGQRVAVGKPGVPLPPPLPPGTAASGPKPEADYIPASRDITVRDLLTHTAGLLTGGLGTQVMGDIPRKPTDRLADIVPLYGKAALDFQPGTRWSYSAGPAFEALSRIVEIVSGKPYDVFLQGTDICSAGHE